MRTVRNAAVIGIVLLHMVAALGKAGSLVVWGEDSYGVIRNTPEGSDFVAVSAGGDHCVALRSDGSLVDWGQDTYGQVSDTPTGNDFMVICAGLYHNGAVRSDGSLVVWGTDIYGLVSDTPTGNDFRAIAAGAQYNIALKSDGSLVAWGIDDGSYLDFGQVSDTPTGNDFAAVSAGNYHCVALKTDGSLVAWGTADGSPYDYGQVADTPTGTDFAAVSAGWHHNVALKSDGSLAAWGYDADGQVSDTPTGNDFVAVSASMYHNVALKSDGSLVAWGRSYTTPVTDTPTGSDFVAVSAGDNHNVAIRRATEELPGSGTAEDPYRISTAEQLNRIGANAALLDKHFELQQDINLGGYACTPIGQYISDGHPDNRPFTGVFDGNGHTISNFSWSSSGDSYKGFFGCVDGPSAMVRNLGLINPQVEGGVGEGIGALAGCLWSGTISRCFVHGGTVTGGDSVGGLVGKCDSAIADSYAVVRVSANWAGGLVGDVNGAITNCYAAGPVQGTNGSGGLVASMEGGSINNCFWDTQTTAVQSGVGEQSGGTVNNLQGLTTLEMQTESAFLNADWDFIDEAANGTEDIWEMPPGNYPQLAWEPDHKIPGPAGSLVAWGIDGRTPADYGQVRHTPAGNHFVAVAAGDYHSVALRSDGSLAVWGGDGPVGDTPAGNDFVAIAAGSWHSVALRSDGSLVAWGSDNSGQVSETPAGNDFVAIAAGSLHNVAVKSDGSLVAWGDDRYFQVTSTPAVGNFTAVAAGGWHSVALRSDGVLVSWGINDGSSLDRGQVDNTPRIADVVAVSAGYIHSVALRSNGSLVAWGSDSYGEVSNTPAGNDFVAVTAGRDHNVALKSDGSLIAWGPDWEVVNEVPAGNDFAAVAAGFLHSVAIVPLTYGVSGFGPDSADFSGVAFLHAQSGEVRTYQGQAGYSGTGFTTSFSEDTYLDVNCLRIDETAVPAHDKESSSLWLAKDRDGRVWLFKVLLDGVELFAASSLDELISCDQGAVPMELRLMTGNWDVGTTITDLAGSTTEVLSTTATLPQFPGQPFVLVKWTSDDGLDVDYEYHHGSRGLILDVWDDSGDVNGDGWILTDFPVVELHDWNGDGLVSIIGDVPPFVDCVYFGDCPGDAVGRGDCNGDGFVSIVGDVPCFVDCVYFGSCP